MIANVINMHSILCQQLHHIVSATDTVLSLFAALVAFSRSVCAILLTRDGPFLSDNKIQERERNGARIVDAQCRRKCTSTGNKRVGLEGIRSPLTSSSRLESSLEIRMDRRSNPYRVGRPKAYGESLFTTCPRNNCTKNCSRNYGRVYIPLVNF